MQTQADTFGKTDHIWKIFGMGKHQRRSFIASNSILGGCIFCGSAEHLIYNWQRFLNLSPNFRQKEAKILLLCLSCLKKSH